MATSAPTCSKGGGKLIPPSSPGAPKNEAKHWVFRWSNYAKHCPEWAAAIDGLLPKCKILVAQEEICPKTGTPHIQGELEFHKKHRPIGMLPKSVKWILKKAITDWHYCQKEKTAIPNSRVWRHGIPRPRRPLEITTESELYGWQLEYAHKFDEPASKDNRYIHWVWSTAGKMGKTTLCRYLYDKNNSGTILIGGKATDIFYMIRQHVSPDEEGEVSKDLDLVLVNICKDSFDKVSYTAIESILDGILSSPKYKGAMVRFNPPHVLVFANAPPRLNGVSEDRWIIKCLDEVVESTLEM